MCCGLADRQTGFEALQSAPGLDLLHIAPAHRHVNAAR
jgi:hypothetical protein